MCNLQFTGKNGKIKKTELATIFQMIFQKSNRDFISLKNGLSVLETKFSEQKSEQMFQLEKILLGTGTGTGWKTNPV